MLCTLCGKNMPALAANRRLSSSVAIYRMEIHPVMKCEDLGTK
jgi:hypothetical protein